MVLTEVEIFRRAIHDYGKVPQKIKAIEELAELINAISVGNPSMVAEEMADVSIMLAQLELIYNNEIEVEGYRSTKLNKKRRKIKPIEELSKLIQVIAKNNDLCLVAEKIADVYIVLDHLKVIYQNADDVEVYRRGKLARLDFRLLRLEEAESN